MVDPNRKINRLTEQDIEFLDECEESFSNRFTEDDEEFMAHCSKPLPTPPIVDNWYSSGGGTSSQYQHRNNYGGGYRGNRNFNRHSGSDGGAGPRRSYPPRGRTYRGSYRQHQDRFPYQAGPSGSGSRNGSGHYNRREVARPPVHQNQQHEQSQALKSIAEIRRGYGNFVAASKSDN